jgi:hypothetical protein
MKIETTEMKWIKYTVPLSSGTNRRLELELRYGGDGGEGLNRIKISKCPEQGSFSVSPADFEAFGKIISTVSGILSDLAQPCPTETLAKLRQ